MAEGKKETILNPFDKGVTYADLLKAIPKGKKVNDYLKNICSSEQIKWIETELENYKLNNKK